MPDDDGAPVPAPHPARRRARCAVVGFGRIGRRIVEGLAADPEGPEPVAILGRAGVPDGLACRTIGDLIARRPDIVVECASAEALATLGPDILVAGITLVPLSLAAFADPTAADRLEAAARQGGARIEIPSGAAGALDLIRAARIAGLARVLFRQAYPPRTWRGTAAETLVDLDRLDGPAAFFRGSAREAAALFPLNLNAATGVALAGLGLDRTEVELVADPALPAVRYDLELEAGTGPVRLSIGPRPAPGPDLTAASVLALLARHGTAILT